MPARKTWRGWPAEEPGYDLEIAGRISDSYRRVSSNPDSDERESIDQQAEAYELWTARKHVVRGATYTDDDESASEFRHGDERPDFARLRADIRAGRLDGHILWVWSSSRLTRGDVALDVIVAECKAHGIVWCFKGKVLNPANYEDLDDAEKDHQTDKSQPRHMRADVKRGKIAAAKKGKPAAVPLYGYARGYERDAAGQPALYKGRPVMSGDVFNGVDDDGSAVPRTPAWVVRYIYDQVEAGASRAGIRTQLEDWGIPAPRFPRKCTTCGLKVSRRSPCPAGHEQNLCQWHTSSVTFIARNEGYIRARIYGAPVGATVAERRAHVLPDVEAMWPAMISDRQFWAVQAVLNASTPRWRGPNRGNTVPDADRHRSVFSVRCTVCGRALGFHAEKGGDWYRCRSAGCTTIKAEWLEDYAEARLVSWLALPEVRTQIWGSREGEDAKLTAARVDLARSQQELAELRALAKLRKISVASFADLEPALAAAVAEAEARTRPVATSLLTDMVGPDAADKWWKLRTERPEAARQLFATVATVYVKRGRRGGVAANSASERCEWHWNIGQNASTHPTISGASEALAERRAAGKVVRANIEAMLRADPATTDAHVGREAGCSYNTVRRIRKRLTEAGEISDPGYRTGSDGKRYATTGNGHPGSPRNSVVTGENKRQGEVLDVARDLGTVRAADVAAKLGMSLKSANGHLAKLAEAGDVVRKSRGVYAAS